MHYDGEADILYIELREVEVACSIEHEWGLIDLGDDGAVVGIEYWDASDHLPPTLLGALPAPDPAVEAGAAGGTAPPR